MTEITFETFGRKLNEAASKMANAEAGIVLAGTAGAASAVTLAYKGATGGDGKLSGTGKARRGTGKAAAVTAKAKDVRRYPDGTYVGLVVPVGPYGLIERDVKPHEISVFRYSTRRRNSILRAARKAAYKEDRSAVQATRFARAGIDARKANALRIPGSKTGYAASAQHPGTKGRDVFSSAVRAAGPKVAKQMLAQTTKAMLDGYKA